MGCLSEFKDTLSNNCRDTGGEQEAFAEAAPVLLAFLPEIVLAAVVIAVLIKLVEKLGQEALVPPAVPPQAPGLVSPALPGGDQTKEGFTAVPSPVEPGEAGTTPAPALPHVEEGPGVAPPMPVVPPKLTPEQEKARDAKLKELNLPTGGEYPFIPPKGWYGQFPLTRGEKKSYLDAAGDEWVKPRGKKEGDEWHWDVQLKKRLPDGRRHRNVNPGGSIHH